MAFREGEEEQNVNDPWSLSLSLEPHWPAFPLNELTNGPSYFAFNKHNDVALSMPS